MAYLMTAIMSGGVAAILALYAGETWGHIFYNYVIYGHIGMATLAIAQMAAGAVDRRSGSQN